MMRVPDEAKQAAAARQELKAGDRVRITGGVWVGRAGEITLLPYEGRVFIELPRTGVVSVDIKHVQRIDTEQPRPFVPHALPEQMQAAEAEENTHAANPDGPTRFERPDVLVDCPKCEGKGYVAPFAGTNAGLGRSVCSDCNGTGKIPVEPTPEPVQEEPNRGAVPYPPNAWTPGPWIDNYPLIQTEDGLVICDVRHAGTHNKNEQVITAVPHLLEFVYQQWIIGMGGYSVPDASMDAADYELRQLADECAALWRQATGGSILDYHVARSGAEWKAREEGSEQG